MSSPREIKTGELLRALIVVGPFVAAYFASRDTALLDLGRYALPVLAATLTLISFSRYNVGFGLRCFSSRSPHPLPAAPAALRRSASPT
jgi:hypothetical protein